MITRTTFVAFIIVGLTVGLFVRLLIRDGSHAEPGITAEYLNQNPTLLAAERASLEALWDSHPNGETHPTPTETVSVEAQPITSQPTVASTRSQWSSFPRLGWSFVHAVQFAPERLIAEDLFRHKELNPLDMELDFAARDKLRMIIATYKPQCEAVRKVIGDAQTREMSLLMAAHKTDVRERNPEEPNRIPIPKDLASEAIVYASLGGGPVHYAPRKAMPVTSSGHEYMRFLGQEVGGHIIGFFMERGCCPTATGQTLLTQLFANK